MSHPAPTDTPEALLHEVTDLVDALGQWLQWAQLGGADALPAQPAIPAEERARLRDLTTAPRATAGPARSAPPPAVVQGPAPTPRPAAGQPTLGNWGRFVQTPAAPSPVGSLDRAGTLAAVRSELGDCQRCGLCHGRRSIVFGVGAERAPLMIIGEGPGAQEDRQGEPFVGKAGQMLDRMLSNVLGLARSDVFITNVVKCRPPGNRNPEAEEIARCRPFLMAQLRVVQPKVVLVLGSVACRAVFDTSAGVTRLRGTWRPLRYPGGEARAMPTFHPAYLLRQPEEKRKTFMDLKAVQAALAEAGG